MNSSAYPGKWRYAEAGDLVFKPRAQWHTFWKAGDTACRILEIIAPGGFEQFLAEVARGAAPAEAGARYGWSSTWRASRACARSTG